MSQTKVQLVAPVGIVTASGVNVSGTITATSYSGSGANLTGVGVGTTASVNTSGIITAVSFFGNGANLSGVGLGSTASASTTGIVTASKFVGSGIGLTNIGGPIGAIIYKPAVGSSNVGVTTNIEITFSKPIQAGVGTITLRTGSASGTIVESFDVTSSNRLTISTAKLTIDPTSDLNESTTYYVVLPSGVLKDTYVGISSNVLIDTYSFTTQAFNYELFMWGYGNYGQLGQNDRTPRSSPTQIPGTQWSFVANSYLQTNAIKTDGTLWVWGYGAYGALAQNDQVNRSSPVQLPGTQWEQITGGYLHSLAKKSDGTLWAWGIGLYGQLGQNNTTYYSSPVQIPGTQWNQLFSNGYAANFSIASKTDGTLWAWGYGATGRLGLNNTIDRSSPVQLPGTQWNTTNKYSISIGNGHVLALKTDGTLWSWGYSSYGVLGLNNQVQYSSPIQIPGTQWSECNAGGYGSMAIKSDGTLWVWGRNDYGQVGINDVIPRSSPIQIPGTQWTKPNSGNISSRSLKTDGTLWMWGYNNFGTLGQNDLTHYSSPRQIPGTQWYFESGEVYESFAIKQIIP
jgi:alpha-tubulin suppressor-like RCC1 family protein